MIGVGSNLGDRRKRLEQAGQALSLVANVRQLKASPIVESPALVPSGAPEEWRRAFLNAVFEIDWLGTAQELLHCLKRIENEAGRELSARWAPRVIDLDLLTFGNETVTEENLGVPHPEVASRQFVLAPLKHLRPSLVMPGHQQGVLEQSRALPAPLPLWMGIVNLTPDSFSDRGVLLDRPALAERLDFFASENTQIFDLGAESTRPDAIKLSALTEWARLETALDIVIDKFRGQIFRPLLSIDTYHPETAVRALEKGVDIINDVSGFADPRMLNVIAEADCQYVFMHSLTVPADPRVRLDTPDPTAVVKAWAQLKLDEFQHRGVNLDRVIFDPGVGFGKSPQQSLTILREIDQLLDLPVRILVGHSRKAFLDPHRLYPAADRDFETLGPSLKLADRGVDILRVHNPPMHQRAFRTQREI